ncbi:OLC1v1012323C1 [Oldenlandia corymbosa var. corymbosa]|nr:OLC1v1012323C1 [Oldenlandia corymbosa var. corymbosa]
MNALSPCSNVDIPNCRMPDSGGNCGNKQAKDVGTVSRSLEPLPSVASNLLMTPGVGCKSCSSGISKINVVDGSSMMSVLSVDAASSMELGVGTKCSGSKELRTHSEEGLMFTPPAVMLETDGSKFSEASLVGNHLEMVPSKNLQLDPPDKTRPGSIEANSAVLDDLEIAQVMDPIDVTGDESKERFRERLWCFLFENLNRAVDELYLLCELECDTDQMKEGILVLEEAASDFRELTSRVEEFERVKKSSSHVHDDTPLTIKSDHRRPHALSWEVRRMTTSPRRAEILSSSLEAFRKIQQERASTRATSGPGGHYRSSDTVEEGGSKSEAKERESVSTPKKQNGLIDLPQGNLSKEKKNTDTNRYSSKASRLPPKEDSSLGVAGRNKRDVIGPACENNKPLPRKDRTLIDSTNEKHSKSVDQLRRLTPASDREKEKRNGSLWNSMDAWKEKRNWEDILGTPHRVSSRFSHSPGLSRKSADRARVLHDKLMSPDKRKKSPSDLKKEAEEKHARATRIRNELESERIQRLQRTSEKLNRVNEFQAERSMKLREEMHSRQQRGESRHEAYLAQVVRRATDESSKVNEVRFITSLNEENKKLIFRQKHHDSELRRAEKRQQMKTKQKEDLASKEAVLERKKLLDAEKLQRIAETQRKKEEAQVRREEERKASSAAREAKAMEQMRRKEVRAKAQQEEAELLAQKLAERLSESEQRRKVYLEQIREKASMDFRDQTSPFLRRSLNKENQGKSAPNNSSDECPENETRSSGPCTLPTGNMTPQQSLKRKIKKIRQKLMSLKHEFSEPSGGVEVTGIGYRSAIGTARMKIGRWIQELQKLRQARKEGTGSFGLITAEMIKFLEGKDAELLASRQAGLLDFIASALPASHTSKPEACQVTLCLLKLLKVVLSVPTNRSYFLSQNFLPPIIPMLATALENYIKIAASANVPGSNSLISSKSSDNLDSISEILDGFLGIVAAILGHASSDNNKIQMQDGLVELVIAYQILHRLRDLFALYDRPHVEGSPFPSSILLSIKFLVVVTARFGSSFSIDWESFSSEITCIKGSIEKKVNEAVDLKGFPDVSEQNPRDVSLNTGKLSTSKEYSDGDEPINTENRVLNGEHESLNIPSDDVVHCLVSSKEVEKSVNLVTGQKEEVKPGLKQPVAFLLSAISETGLVCLPSMLTAVLLQANNRLSSEQVHYILPSNFEEVATGVLRVLNNLALIDVTFIQRMLARPDLKMEFFHLMSFLLSHCSSKWCVATDQIGQLLLESLSLLGYFALFHHENQAVLRWGKSPTILHKVCDLPFDFFSDPELMPVLAGTVIAACFGCEQNKKVVLQELSADMLLSLIKSYRNNMPPVQSISALDNPPPDEAGEPNQSSAEPRKTQVENPNSQKSHRHSTRNSRSLPQRSAGANGSKIKMRNQRENKIGKLSEEMVPKSTQFETSALMLHCSFPGTFIDRAEQFFSV